MKVIRGTIVLVVLAGWLVAAPAISGLSTDKPGGDTRSKADPEGIPAASPNLLEPQIVRLSYVQGDVRVSRGKEAEKATHMEWGRAEVDLPLESGYSLVTGEGRAEVEFEDSSVVYLAENSVLLLNELTTTNGVPHTEVSLLSGTMTLSARPLPGEWFSVRTPTDGFGVKYPEKTLVRVESYLDAMSLTGLNPTVFHLDGSAAVHGLPNQTVNFRAGQKVYLDQVADADAFSAWDAWVAGRVAERDRATAQVMKASGLKTPIPGLAAMAEQGTFYPCAPFGTCWEPKDGWSGSAQQPQTAQVQAAPAQAAGEQPIPIGALNVQLPGPAQSRRQAAYIPGTLSEQDEEFPCTPLLVHNWYGIDPVTGKRVLVRSEPDWAFGGIGSAWQGYGPLSRPYGWAVCHAGTWVHREHRYAWVVGTKKHHHCPVHWVQAGRAVGFVPVHPRDVVGKPPVNLQNGIFHPVDKKGDGVEMIAADGAQPVKVLEEAPKQFRGDAYVFLTRVDAPKVEGHLFQDGPRAGRFVVAKTAGMPITFDRKSQSFVVARQVNAGSATKMIAEPIGGRGSSLQTRVPNSAEMVRSSSSGSSSSMAGVRGYSGGGSSAGASSGGGASHASSAPVAASGPAAAPAPAASFSSGAASSAASSGGGKSH